MGRILDAQVGSAELRGNARSAVDRRNGYRSAGPGREVTLEYTEDPAGWVTELQEPIAAV